VQAACAGCDRHPCTLSVECVSLTTPSVTTIRQTKRAAHARKSRGRVRSALRPTEGAGRGVQTLGDDRRLLVSPYIDSSGKRAVDLLLSIPLLLPAALIMLVIAALIWAVDGRPVLLLQPRVGRCGSIFLMPKFQTMRCQMSPPLAQVTALGEWLRKHRLDEWPQLLCVLSGKMSLVGPRPELVDIVQGYGPQQEVRLLCRPGLTGLWQVRATRMRPIHQNLRYDRLYLRRASFLVDLAILAETVRFVTCPRGDQT